jgi:hypothetical protein
MSGDGCCLEAEAAVGETRPLQLHGHALLEEGPPEGRTPLAEMVPDRACQRRAARPTRAGTRRATGTPRVIGGGRDHLRRPVPKRVIGRVVELGHGDADEAEDATAPSAAAAPAESGHRTRSGWVAHSHAVVAWLKQIDLTRQRRLVLAVLSGHAWRSVPTDSPSGSSRSAPRCASAPARPPAHHASGRFLKRSELGVPVESGATRLSRSSGMEHVAITDARHPADPCTSGSRPW